MIRWRVLVVEAMVLLLAARLLIAGLRFGWWRGLLGEQGGVASPVVPGEADRLLARAVERGAARLPGESKCLPRAMALYWMLARRGRASQLVIAVLPGSVRGGLDDLHAWVERGGEVLIGQLDQPFHPLARFGSGAKV